MTYLCNFYNKLSSVNIYNFYLLFFKTKHTKSFYFTVSLILSKIFSISLEKVDFLRNRTITFYKKCFQSVLGKKIFGTASKHLSDNRKPITVNSQPKTHNLQPITSITTLPSLFNG